MEQGRKGRESGGSVSLVGPRGGGGGAAFALDSRTYLCRRSRPSLVLAARDLEGQERGAEEGRVGERRGRCQQGNQVAAVVSLGAAPVDELGVLAERLGCLYKGVGWRIFLDRQIHERVPCSCSSW